MCCSHGFSWRRGSGGSTRGPAMGLIVCSCALPCRRRLNMKYMARQASAVAAARPRPAMTT